MLLTNLGNRWSSLNALLRRGVVADSAALIGILGLAFSDNIKDLASGTIKKFEVKAVCGFNSARQIVDTGKPVIIIAKFFNDENDAAWDGFWAALDSALEDKMVLVKSCSRYDPTRLCGRI